MLNLVSFHKECMDKKAYWSRAVTLIHLGMPRIHGIKSIRESAAKNNSNPWQKAPIRQPAIRVFHGKKSSIRAISDSYCRFIPQISVYGKSRLERSYQTSA